MATLPRLTPKQLTPSVRVDTVYLKPLMRNLQGFEMDPDAILRKLKADMLRRMRRKLLQETFSKEAVKALSKALTIQVRGSSLLITAKHPAWFPLVEGRRSGPMRWLAKARAPIPIITESGKIIFRSATARSLQDGRWRHPGRQKSHFYDRAREEAREFLRTKLAGEFRQQLMKAM